jgi:hypothetical protein
VTARMSSIGRADFDRVLEPLRALDAVPGDVLHVGPTGLGLLRTAPGAGAALCAIFLAFTPILRHVGRWMFGGVALFGAMTVLFGLSTSFAVSLAALFFLGVGDMVSVYIDPRYAPLARVRARGSRACPTPRRRSDLPPGPGSGASTASQTRPFASARRRTGGPGTSRAPCGAGFAKVWFARGFARTCSPG